MSGFYLESNHHVPEHILNKINKASGAFMENGLRQFYTTHSQFIMQLKSTRVDQLKHEVQQVKEVNLALTMEQLGRPLKLAAYLWAFALIIFIVEKLTFM